MDFFSLSLSSSSSALNGAARMATVSTASSACATSSTACGSASCSALASRRSATSVRSSASALLLFSSALCWTFPSIPLALVISPPRVVCRFRSFGSSFESSLVLAGGAPLILASLISWERLFCACATTACCAFSTPSASAIVSSVESSIISRTFSRTCWDSASTAATRAKISWTLSSLRDGLARAAGVGVLGLVAGAAAALTGVTWRMSLFAGASHGILQPVTGGMSPWAFARDHTWEPPTWSPNHQPQKSAPSRESQ
mmetsp:Transcript_7817/g.21204  ORF Transcript_7817/g.21204 Transcript_7817/m.21204 type:complete len:259 (+) Transcript_7817:1648-2424(+)